MKHEIVEVGDVIQVDGFEGWDGCLMIVDEVKTWGVLAGMVMPRQGAAFIRLLHGSYHKIGKAVLVIGED